MVEQTKEPVSDCMLNPPKSNTGSGHIVYVRRKPETELGKSQQGETPSDPIDCPHLKKSTEQVETTMEHAEPVICISGDVSPPQRASSPSFSSSRYSASPSPVNCVHTDCGNPSSDDPETVNVTIGEERYRCLQSLLKMLDQSDQDDYRRMLRSLSSVELSRHAVELEKRSIKLSLEEAKEQKRVRFFDVLGKYPKNVGTPACQQEQQLQKN